MRSATTRKTALVLIDVQNGFLHPTFWGTSRSTPQCEKNIEQLLLGARKYNQHLATDDASEDHSILICHIHHHSIYPDSELHPTKQIEVNGKTVSAVQAQDFAASLSGENVWTKNVNSGFIGTGLEAFLREHKVRQLVICGITTDHCVSTTTRMANNLRVVDVVGEDGKVVEEGDIVLVGDACATYAKGGFDAETVHQVNLATLDGEFAQVVGTEDVLGTIFAK